MTSGLVFSNDVENIQGIGPKKRDRLEVLGIRTVGDLIRHYPFRYRDRRQPVTSDIAAEDRDVLVCGTLTRKNSRPIRGSRVIVECAFRDDGGTFSAVFFGVQYIAKTLQIGQRYAVFGKMKRRNGLAVWTNPEIVLCDSEQDLREIVPVYRCTRGITNKDIGKWVRTALYQWDDIEKDWLDDSLIKENNLCSRAYAYRNIHFPQGEKEYKYAKYRLSYDELLIYQYIIRRNRAALDNESLDASVEDTDISLFEETLPFALTDGQKDAVRQIEEDLISKRPMNRLVQGDVGCGKTAVAECAIYKVVKAGHQAAFMAPTEILARQHYNKLQEAFEPLGIRTSLLTSGMKASERRSLLADLADGQIDVIVGTHALIQDDVEYNDLMLVITDEQHRFGVNQRKSLVRKGKGVNVLVMSATPIPRTLAATVYGDMDYSIIRTKPANRLPIITRAFTKGTRAKAYAQVRRELDKGRLAYVVAPSIDSDNEDISSVEKLYEELSKQFKGYKAALIHGRMAREDKEKIMLDFAAGRIQMLIATVVIEVGIDVPDASIIVIEGCDRFGLAQLHQLRGRVGRSDNQSYCCLINYSSSDAAAERTDAMVRLADGFEISEEDYRLRGPGDIMGTMQHGAYQSRILSLSRNEHLLNASIRDAERIIEDPSLIVDNSEIESVLNRITESDNSEII